MMRNGIFPNAIDGAIRPNEDMPNAPPQAFAPSTLPEDTAALYFSGACNLRLRPSVMNTVISEIIATVDRAGLSYRTTSLQNLETAIRYLIQRGIPRGALIKAEDPWHFNVTLDPPATAYTDFMTLTLVPELAVTATQNVGYVRVNVNDLGYVPLLRNDCEELRARDLLPGRPLIVSYFAGAFYHVGLTNSQVPLILLGDIDFWIRPDGNDETGDGTANSADKAFRTIDGAWAAVGSRYSASPSSHIIFRLGIQGDYEGATIGPYGASVSIIGDPKNAEFYRVRTKTYGPDEGPAHAAWSLRVAGINNFSMHGINLQMDYAGETPNGCQCLRVTSSTAAYYDCFFTAQVSNPVGDFIVCESHAVLHNFNANVFDGRGNTIAVGIYTGSKAMHPGQPSGPLPASQAFRNVTFTAAGYLIAEHGQIAHANTFVNLTNVVGPRYYVASGGLLFPRGQPVPGSTAGSVASLGQVL